MYTFMKLEEYSDKDIVIRGAYTKKYVEQLKSMNGKFKHNLTGGPGWIFSKIHKDKLNIFIENKNKECEQEFFDKKDSFDYSSESFKDEKKYLQYLFETERNNLSNERIALETERNKLSKERIALETDRNNLKNNRDIFEYDSIENKRMNEFNKFNKRILKVKRILKLTFIFYFMVYIFKYNMVI